MPYIAQHQPGGRRRTRAINDMRRDALEVLAKVNAILDEEAAAVRPQDDIPTVAPKPEYL